jgi:hypothetical protein
MNGTAFVKRSLLYPLAGIVAVASACGDVNTALQRQSEARHLVADLHVQFARAADASNRAVMANTDEAAEAAARDAEHATAAVRQEMATLHTRLSELNYTDEARELESFAATFGAYETLDRQILDLVVEQSNLKAQRLAFGPASEAADAMRAALDGLTLASGAQAWRVKALAAEAVASVREIQAIQSPHIADADDALMDAREKRMAEAERRARQSLDELAGVVAPAARPKLETANGAFTQFLVVNKELVTLSRRNTNVRSLALSLNEKRALVSRCEASLLKLREALAKRGYPAGRVPPAPH